MEGSSMKYRIALAFTLFALSAGSYANTLCQEKEHDIQREISYAEKHNNQSRINGLNKALSEVRANCSDSKLRADHQKKIAAQKDEIAERKRDLAEAKQKGDTDKITKREHKLAEAQNELKELESRDY
jgi:chromosome segregation ATPase